MRYERPNAQATCCEILVNADWKTGQIRTILGECNFKKEPQSCPQNCAVAFMDRTFKIPLPNPSHYPEKKTMIEPPRITKISSQIQKTEQPSIKQNPKKIRSMKNTFYNDRRKDGLDPNEN